MSSNPFGICLEPRCDDEEPQPELPSFKEMAKGFIGSAKDVLFGAFKGEDVIVTEEVYNTRINICNSCEFFRKDDKRCSKCGCFMEAKTRFKSTYCPIHKWEAE
jgi:hypothetical protein